MAPIFALVALTLFMWAVAVWTTWEEVAPNKPERKTTTEPTDRPAELRKAA